MVQQENIHDIKSLSNKLIKDIQAGAIQDDDGKLPSEQVMMRLYHVTRYTLRQVLEHLSNLGYIRQVHGIGTFARSHHNRGAISLQNNVGLTEEFARQGKTVKTVSTSQRIVPVSQAEFLPDSNQLPADAKLISVIRQRTLDDVPFLVEHSYYLKSVVGEIPEEALYGSLFAYIEKTPEFQVGFIDSIIDCELISGLPVQFFGVHSGSPSIVVQDDSYLISGQLFAFSKIYYDYRVTKFSLFKKMH